MEGGKLYVLEAHPGRRSPQASVRAAVSLVKEKVLTEREAVLRIDPRKMDYYLHPVIDPALSTVERTIITAFLVFAPHFLATFNVYMPLRCITHFTADVSSLEMLCVGRGVGASAGAAVGVLAFTSDEVRAISGEGAKAILCLQEATFVDENVIKVRTLQAPHLHDL